jgi:hypothetical protein
MKIVIKVNFFLLLFSCCGGDTGRGVLQSGAKHYMIRGMIVRRFVVFLVMVLLVGGGLFPVEEAGESEKGQEKPAAVIKVIPGAFQLKSGKIVKGTLLLGLFAAAAAGAVVENNRGNAAYRQYVDSTDVAEIVRLRQETEDHFKRRNYYIGGLIGVWLVHLLDLKFSRGKKKGGIQSDVSKDSFSVGFYYSF